MNRLLEKKIREITGQYTEMNEDEFVRVLIQRDEEVQAYFGFWADMRRNRIEATRRLCHFPVTLANLHTHSIYGDGATYGIQEISEWANKYGLDWGTVTDHGTLEHRKLCQEFTNLWWGEEANLGGHDFLVFGLDQPVTGENKSRPIQQALDRIKQREGVAIFAHPCGTRSVRWEDPEHILKLAQGLEGLSGLEVINSGGHLFNPRDTVNDSVIRIWDTLLARGRRTLAFGNTDAHVAQKLGAVWNGFIGKIKTREELLSRLKSGNHFVSDGPIVQLQVNDCPMGSKVECSGQPVQIRIEAFDSEGIDQVRLIRNGKILHQKNYNAKPKIILKFKDKLEKSNTYYRVETETTDYRHAYSNPVWVI